MFKPIPILALTLLFLNLPVSAYALNEIFELVSPVQVVAQGYAVTSSTSGYFSNYYNPAGIAKGSRRKVEVTPIDFQSSFSLGGAGGAIVSRSLGWYTLIPAAQTRAATYTQFQVSSVPGISARGFALSPYLNYRYAAESDGAQIDVDSVYDLGATLGGGIQLLGSRLKVGIVGKIINREQIKGVFNHALVSDRQLIDAQTKEGFGVGGDLGIIYTIPYRYLLSVGAVWQDVGGTRFQSSHWLNASASGGIPDSIPQSFHAGFSLQPKWGKQWRATFSLDFRHLERSDLSVFKKMHLGAQFENEKSWFYWIGLNRLWPSAGLGMRMPGGNLELSVFGEEIGTVDSSRLSLRTSLRYTIGF